jgi:uncharacterized damage-inducible protein DinB
MKGRPEANEADPYYSYVIDPVPGDDIVSVLESQLEETPAFLRGISEEKSLYRYAPEKWSIRQVVSHINDVERIFLSRALWFARGFDSPLPSFDQNDCAVAARADAVPWANHIEDFRAVRLATLSFFRNLPEEAWLCRGIASDRSFTVRALAYITAGHVIHHTGVIRERYL